MTGAGAWVIIGLVVGQIIGVSVIIARNGLTVKEWSFCFCGWVTLTWGLLYQLPFLADYIITPLWLILSGILVVAIECSFTRWIDDLFDTSASTLVRVVPRSVPTYRPEQVD